MRSTRLRQSLGALPASALGALGVVFFAACLKWGHWPSHAVQVSVLWALCAGLGLLATAIRRPHPVRALRYRGTALIGAYGVTLLAGPGYGLLPAWLTCLGLTGLAALLLRCADRRWAPALTGAGLTALYLAPVVALPGAGGRHFALAYGLGVAVIALRASVRHRWLGLAETALLGGACLVGWASDRPPVPMAFGLQQVGVLAYLAAYLAWAVAWPRAATRERPLTWRADQALAAGLVTVVVGVSLLEAFLLPVRLFGGTCIILALALLLLPFPSPHGPVEGYSRPLQRPVANALAALLLALGGLCTTHGLATALWLFVEAACLALTAGPVLSAQRVIAWLLTIVGLVCLWVAGSVVGPVLAWLGCAGVALGIQRVRPWEACAYGVATVLSTIVLEHALAPNLATAAPGLVWLGVGLAALAARQQAPLLFRGYAGFTALCWCVLLFVSDDGHRVAQTATLVLSALIGIGYGWAVRVRRLQRIRALQL